MTHIAIQEALNGKAVEWMEQVTEEQYRKLKLIAESLRKPSKSVYSPMILTSTRLRRPPSNSP